MADETLTLRVELIEQRLLEVELYVVDILAGTMHNIEDFDDTNITNVQDGDILIREGNYWINQPLEELESEIPKFIYNEIPTKINSKRFQVANVFRTGTLRVTLNGIKEKEIVIIDSNIFEFKIDTIITDTIECNYIKS